MANEEQIAQDRKATAAALLAAVGGRENLLDVEACITRLRMEVADSALVNEAALKDAGAFGVVMQEKVVHVIMGPEAEHLEGLLAE